MALLSLDRDNGVQKGLRCVLYSPVDILALAWFAFWEDAR